MGNVLSAMSGQAPARQATLGAGRCPYIYLDHNVSRR